MKVKTDLDVLLSKCAFIGVLEFLQSTKGMLIIEHEFFTTNPNLKPKHSTNPNPNPKPKH